MGLTPLFLGGVKPAHRSTFFRVLTLASRVVHTSLSRKPLPMGAQERGAILTCHVRDKLGISLEQHLGGGVAQLLCDLLGIFPGGEH